MRSILCIVVALSAALPASAQEGVDWGGLMAGIAHGTAMDEAAQESVERNRGDKDASAATPAERFRYTPSLERRRANLARFVERSRERDPAGAAALEAQLAGSDPIEKIGDALAPLGMRTDDLADAYAIWWLNAWLAAHERNDTPPAGQIAAVRIQAAKALASVPALAGAGDAARQETAEAYLIQTMLIGSMMDQVEHDPAQRSRLAAAVRKGAEASGLDLDAMALSDSGFVPAGRASASRQDDRGGKGIVYAVAAACAAGLIGGIWLGRRRNPRTAPHG